MTLSSITSRNQSSPSSSSATADPDAGVVDQHVEPPSLRERRRHQPLALGGVRQVALDRRSASVNDAANASSRRPTPRRHDDPRPDGVEHAGEPLAQP